MLASFFAVCFSLSLAAPRSHAGTLSNSISLLFFYFLLIFSFASVLFEKERRTEAHNVSSLLSRLSLLQSPLPLLSSVPHALTRVSCASPPFETAAGIRPLSSIYRTGWVFIPSSFHCPRFLRVSPWGGLFSSFSSFSLFISVRRVPSLCRVPSRRFHIIYLQSVASPSSCGSLSLPYLIFFFSILKAWGSQ